MAEKIFVNKKGSCICGAINFTVKLDEIPRVFNCHCQDCRKKIGGMISIIELRENAIDIEMSKLSIYEHNGGSEKKIKKHFCKKCAAPVLTYVEKWNKYLEVYPDDAAALSNRGNVKLVIGDLKGSISDQDMAINLIELKY